MFYVRVSKVPNLRDLPRKVEVEFIDILVGNQNSDTHIKMPTDYTIQRETWRKNSHVDGH